MTHKRLEEVESEIKRLISNEGFHYGKQNFCYIAEHLSEDTLDKVHTLLVEKLKIQIHLFNLQGGDLSNVSFLTSVR